MEPQAVPGRRKAPVAQRGATGALLPMALGELRLPAASPLPGRLLGARLLPASLLPASLLAGRLLATGLLAACRLLGSALLPPSLLPASLLAAGLLAAGLLAAGLLAACLLSTCCHFLFTPQFTNQRELPLSQRIGSTEPNLMWKQMFLDWKHAVPHAVAGNSRHSEIGMSTKFPKKTHRSPDRCVPWCSPERPGHRLASAYLPRFRLCRFLARCFRYLCLRIFLRRFLMTLPIRSPSLMLPRARILVGATGSRGRRCGAGCYTAPGRCQAPCAGTAALIGAPTRAWIRPSRRLTMCPRGRKGRAGFRRSPSSASLRRRRSFSGSTIRPRRR